MRINVLRKGDEVLTVNETFIAVKRKNGEVEIIPIVKDDMGVRVDFDGIITIGYGNNEVVMESDGVKIINF